MNNTENELLEEYFEAFGIPEEKRNNEKLQKEILKYLKQCSSTSFLNLFIESLGFFIRCLWIFFVDSSKCLGIAFAAPFVIFWNTLKDIKTHLKKRIFILKHKSLIGELKGTDYEF
ncbi:MAG: hypothetical protein K2I71_01725 [Helicobacter sp.]|nr:hypothetical protein [Helicobacter sp.]